MTLTMQDLNRFPHPNAPDQLINWKPGRVLSYRTDDSGWSDELTNLHEIEANGGQHPVDLASRHLAVKAMLQNAQKLIGPPLALEVGCSSGFLLRDLFAAGSFRIIGSDFIAGPLKKIASQFPKIPILQFDLTKCPLADSSIDQVVALNVLEHIEQDELALRQIFRILKPGGFCYLEVPADPKCFDAYDEVLMHFRRYTIQDLVQKAKSAGFNVIYKTHLGFFPFPVFWLIKKWSRWNPPLKCEREKKVRQQIRNSKSSLILKTMVRVEIFLGQWITFPFGIRAIVHLEKPFSRI